MAKEKTDSLNISIANIETSLAIASSEGDTKRVALLKKILDRFLLEKKNRVKNNYDVACSSK